MDHLKLTVPSNAFDYVMQFTFIDSAQSIRFIYFYFSDSYVEQLADIVQTAFVTILRSCTSLNGCLTKVIMFDKGLTYLVVFGLPGFIQDNQVLGHSFSEFVARQNLKYGCHRSDCERSQVRIRNGGTVKSNEIGPRSFHRSNNGCNLLRGYWSSTET